MATAGALTGAHSLPQKKRGRPGAARASRRRGGRPPSGRFRERGVPCGRNASPAVDRRKMSLFNSILTRLRTKLFTSGQMHLIERLLREQGRKHAKGYVIAFAMMAVIAAATTLSAWIMRDIINRIFVDRSISAMWAIGAHDHGDLCRQGLRHLWPAGGAVENRQQHHRRNPDAHFRENAGDGHQLLQRPPFHRIHRPPGLHRPVGERRAQHAHPGARARRPDHHRPGLHHVRPGPGWRRSPS